MKNIEEILEAHDAVMKANNPLFEQQEGDYGLFRGQPYESEKGYQSFTANTPQNVARKVIDLVSKAPKRIWIPITNEVEVERRLISDSERMAKGCFTLIDRQLAMKGEPKLQNKMAFHAVVRGWIMPYMLILKSTKDKSTTIKADLLDRRWTSYEIGEYGPLWVCSEHTISPRQAKYLYDIEVKDEDKVRVYYFFDNKNFGIFTATGDEESRKENGKWVVELTPHGFKRTPVIIKPVGSTPYIASTKYQDTIKDVGESVYSNTRNLYEPNNRILSWMMDFIARGRKPQKLHYSMRGDRTLEDDPDKPGAEIALSVQEKEDIKYLDNPRMPFETPTMLQIADGLIQQGTMPNIAFGNAPFAISGTAESLLLYGMGSLMDRFAESVEGCYQEMAQMTCEQFATGGFRPIEVPVDIDKNGKKLQRGYNILEKFKTNQIKGYEFKCKLSLGLPQDEMKKWQIATLAHGGPNPLLDARTVRERILEIEDTDNIDDQLLEEFARSEPTIKMTLILDAMKRRGAPPEQWMPIALDLQELRNQRIKQYINSMGGGSGGQATGQPSSTTGVVPPPNMAPPTTQTGAGPQPIM